MDEQSLNKRIRELIREIANLPTSKKKQPAPLIGDTKTKTDMDKINSSLCDLRIMVKYLQFDLEATKRERDALRKKLENLPPDIEGDMQ
jgi:hypothetical protein